MIGIRMNNNLMWLGKAGQFSGWAKAMEDNYGKDALLVDVIKDIKEKRLKRQMDFMNKQYGYSKDEKE